MPPPPATLPSGASPDMSGTLNWWQSILLAGTSALFGVVAVVMAQSGSGASPKPQVLFRYVPHFLLLFGILADAFTYQGVYWTSTVVGLSGYAGGPKLEWIIGNVMNAVAYGYKRSRGASAEDANAAFSAPAGKPIAQDGTYDGCTFGGGSPVTVAVPPTLTASSSVMWYYIIDSIDNRGFPSAIGTMVAFMALYGAQVMSIMGCMTNLGSGAGWGLVYGLIVAGILYSLIKSFGPQFLPSSVVNAGGSGGPSGTGTGASATGSTTGTGSTPTSCTG